MVGLFVLVCGLGFVLFFGACLPCMPLSPFHSTSAWSLTRELVDQKNPLPVWRVAEKLEGFHLWTRQELISPPSAVKPGRHGRQVPESSISCLYC